MTSAVSFNAVSAAAVRGGRRAAARTVGTRSNGPVVAVTCVSGDGKGSGSGGGATRGGRVADMGVAAPRRVGLASSGTRFRKSAACPLYGLESKGKVGGASKELEEAAGAPNDPGETDAAAEVEEEEPKADLGSQIQALKNQGKGDDRVSSTTVKAGGDPDNDNMVVGAFEEIGQIEWPTPGAALTTTGIVIGIVTASTFVLLTVNSVLSSVSTAIFG